MPLRLTITSYHKLTPGQRSEHQLGEGTLTIGRGPENDWVLPDPERLVSSQHCTVQCRDGVYYLTDNSTNGVFLVQSAIRMRRGNSERLENGETIRLGEYDILVQLDQGYGSAAASMAQQVGINTGTGASSGAGLSSGAGSDPFTSFDALMSRQTAAEVTPTFAPIPEKLAGHFQGSSPLDTKPDLFDFLNPAPTGVSSQPDHVPAERHDFRPPTPVYNTPAATPTSPAAAPAQPPGALIPADWDPFADLTSDAKPFTPEPPVAPQPPAQVYPLAEQPEVFVELPDLDFSPEPAPTVDPWAGILADTPAEPAPRPQNTVIPEPRVAKPQPQLPPLPPVSVPATPEPVPQPAPPQPITPLPPATADVGSDRLLQAFLRGAGIPQMRVDPAQAEAQMEAIGRSYRQLVEGLIDVLRARSSLKGEFRMNQTTIQPVHNNPLKFAPNVDEALLLLLRPGNQAFMPPDQAVLVDMANQRFYFFFIEIWPQEFWAVAGLLVMAGVGLFLVTSAVGRAWCGYTCPQTVWV
ncbi:MAG: type VI secretion system-associated FHA domain protein TagH, partial [Pseudomonas sp.]